MTMEKQKKYDVFISSKSEDYPIACEICSFLESRGYVVFFAKKSIPFGADSLFKKTIDNALDAAKNMLVVCSNPEYLKDGWVYYEWNTFSVEILSGRKSNSNILTIINSSLSVNQLPIGLRSYQSLYIDSYKETICDFLGRNVSILSNTTIENVIYKLRVNYACRLFIDDEYIRNVEPNKVAKITLPIGEYLRKVVAIDDECICDERKIQLLNMSKFEDIKLENTNYETIEDVTINQQQLDNLGNKSTDNNNLVAEAEFSYFGSCDTSFDYNGLRYSLDHVNNAIQVKEIIADYRTLYIPEEVIYNNQKFSVTSIGEKAFQGNLSLTTIFIPRTVKNIGDFAFDGCKSLQSIFLSDGLNNIGDFAFLDCPSLAFISLPSSVVKIGAYAFMLCSALTTIEIPKGSYSKFVVMEGVKGLEDKLKEQ